MSTDFTEELNALAKALEECPSLQDSDGRKDILHDLETSIGGTISHSDTRSIHVRNMVRACTDIPGAEGIERLLKVVGERDREKRQWQKVVACAEALKVKLAASAPPGRNSPALKPLEGACGLVIGIRKYDQTQHILPSGEKRLAEGKKLEEEDQTHPFNDLRFSDRDAIAFHRFLTESGCLAGDKPLVNEKATRLAIMRSLDQLCLQSKVAGNSKVVIFFSGHGARDTSGRYYLVPHDGMRDDLLATAVCSEMIDAALKPLKGTRNVIFFVDACHAEGAGAPGEKGEQGCDPEEFVNEGRYVVASCQKEQWSRESQGAGIFSSQLLQLLRFEDGEDAVERELFDLIPLLEEKVSEITGGNQKPWSNVRERTGIWLARNEKALKLRRRWQEALRDQLREHFEARKDQKVRDISPEMIECIEIIIEGGKISGRERGFCDYFLSVAARLKGVPAAADDIEITANRLIGKWTGTVPVQSPVSDRLGVVAKTQPSPELKEPAASPPEAPSSAVQSQPVAVVDQRIASAPEAASKQVGAVSGSSVPTPKGEKSVLKVEDVKVILAVIPDDPLYGGALITLQAILESPEGVSNEQYMKWVRETHAGGDKEEWGRVVDEMGRLFKAAWEKGKKLQSPLSVRFR